MIHVDTELVRWRASTEGSDEAAPSERFVSVGDL